MLAKAIAVLSAKDRVIDKENILITSLQMHECKHLSNNVYTWMDIYRDWYNFISLLEYELLVTVY